MSTLTNLVEAVRGKRPVRLLLAGTITAGVSLAGWGSPAGAATTVDPGLRSLCAQVAEMPPEGAELTTDPPQGAPLQAGQTVTVTLRWDPRAFAGSDVARAAHCVVTLDGRLRLDLSGSEAPSPNDGVYRGSFVVPAELAPGDCLLSSVSPPGSAPTAVAAAWAATPVSR